MTARKVLAVAAGLFFGYAVASLFLIGYIDFAVAMSLSMLCLIANGAIRWVQERRDRTRIGREAVWMRREAQARKKVS